jgi:uncharacterized protein (DUF952 family)
MVVKKEMSMDSIVHICSMEEWRIAQAAGVYRADSLKIDGFIHCSRPEQVVGVANRYYEGRVDLLLLWIDPSKLTAELRWESSEGDVYPHLYGPLNLTAILQVSAFSPKADGVFTSLPDKAM